MKGAAQVQRPVFTLGESVTTWYTEIIAPDDGLPERGIADKPFSI